MRRNYLVAGAILAFSTGVFLTGCGPKEEAKKPEPQKSMEQTTPVDNRLAKSGTGVEFVNVDYQCADGKTINAVFVVGLNTGSTTLNLSDNRTLALIQTVSASGTRYANADESVVFWSKGEMAWLEEAGTETYKDCAQIKPAAENTQLANPASTNCLNKGGKLEMKKRGDGGEYGLCNFEDGRACEEWALMREECPMGGVKTTGFDNEEQRYCAWLGGQTIAAEQANCTLKDGQTCPVGQLFSGQCPMAK